MTLVARKPDYSDLDLDFIAHPTTKDVVRKFGEDAIKRSVRNLILTNHYDRPFRSWLGSDVQKLLFDNLNPLTANILKDKIFEVIRNFEPRVSVRDVQVSESSDFDKNGINVSITYVIVNRNQPVQINLFLERIR
jgi:phage baseplate assembly protein W